MIIIIFYFLILIFIRTFADKINKTISYGRY